MSAADPKNTWSVIIGDPALNDTDATIGRPRIEWFDCKKIVGRSFRHDKFSSPLTRR